MSTDATPESGTPYEFSSSEDEAPPGQAERAPGGAAMDGDAAMTAAVEATLRALPPGMAPPDAAALGAARERARQMLEEGGAEDSAGLRDMHNLTLSFGLPATRAVFRQMVKFAVGQGAASRAAKRAALQSIKEFSPITEVGCMQVDFFNQATQRPDIAYLLLDQCPKGHDFGAQLDKIKPVVLPAKWPEVLHHLSMLVFLGRSVYASTARQQLPLIRSLFGLAAGDPCEPYLTLQVDPANTTLYLDAGWPNRVGVFVHLDAEVRDGTK